jgi:hypothetical protein
MNRRMPRKAAKPVTRRVTANIPADVLASARQETGKGITETLVEGLQVLRQRGVLRQLEPLRGKLDLDIDVDALRGRPRH